MGVWCPGQEVKLAPLVLIFSHNIFKMVDPKQISVIFKSEKQRKKKTVVSSFLSCSYTYKAIIYTFLQERITYSELLSDLCPICTKWLVYYFLHQDDFSTPLKRRPGHVPPLHPPATPLISCPPGRIEELSFLLLGEKAKTKTWSSV